MSNILTSTVSATTIVLVVVLVACVAMFALNFVKSKKDSERQEELYSRIKVGSKVRTFGGIIGVVEDMRETTNGYNILLKSGLENKVSYLYVDLKSVYKLEEEQTQQIQEEQTTEQQ